VLTRPSWHWDVVQREHAFHPLHPPLRYFTPMLDSFRLFIPLSTFTYYPSVSLCSHLSLSHSQSHRSLLCVLSGVADAMQNASSNLVGIGLTPEAIETNPIIYDFMMEFAWNEAPRDVDSWVEGWADRRYGHADESHARAYWQVGLLVKDILSGGKYHTITQHFTTRHYPTLYYTRLLHYTQHYTTLRYYITLHYILHYITLNDATLHDDPKIPTRHDSTLHDRTSLALCCRRFVQTS
jgi:hypothetical protein